MRIEHERLTSTDRFPPWVRHEHHARYLFAAGYAQDKVVVDCACGDGSALRIIAPRAAKAHGFDLSEDAVGAAARSLSAAGNVEVAVADATVLPFADGAADLYVSLETIEHLAEVDPFLLEVMRVLNGDGMFICSTPDRDVVSPGNALNSRPWNRFHTREYTQPEFRALLSRYFGRIEFFGQNPKSPRLVQVRVGLGRLLPGYAMVRINQALKLPRYLYDSLGKHAVVPVKAERRYEYLTAVCSLPRVVADG